MGYTEEELPGSLVDELEHKVLTPEQRHFAGFQARVSAGRCVCGGVRLGAGRNRRLVGGQGLGLGLALGLGVCVCVWRGSSSQQDAARVGEEGTCCTLTPPAAAPLTVAVVAAAPAVLPPLCCPHCSPQIGREPSQCLRYCFDPAARPLWPCSKGIPGPGACAGCSLPCLPACCSTRKK